MGDLLLFLNTPVSMDQALPMIGYAVAGLLGGLALLWLLVRLRDRPRGAKRPAVQEQPREQPQEAPAPEPEPEPEAAKPRSGRSTMDAILIMLNVGGLVTVLAGVLVLWPQLGPVVIIGIGGVAGGLALIGYLVWIRNGLLIPTVASLAKGMPSKLKAVTSRYRNLVLPKVTSLAKTVKTAKTTKPPKEKKQPVVRNWAWFLDQVEEAQEDREFTMMHPSRVSNPRGMKALKRHQRRWKRMAKAPGGLLDGLMVYIAPAKGYKQAFIRALCFERDDEVEPEVPTAIVETWLPKATVADQPVKWRCDTGGNVMHSPNAYMRLTLPPGMLVSELLAMKQYYSLENDDYRMEDIIHVERRAADRELQTTGVLAAEVDSFEDEAAKYKFLAEYWPHAAGVTLPVIMGVFFLIQAGG